MTDKAVVLLSGGIDSATCLAIACREFGEVTPVHFGYGQQTAQLEFNMAKFQRQHLANSEYPDTRVNHIWYVNYSSVFSHFAEGVADPGKDFSSMNEEDGRSSGYVPMRNLHFIATAAAIADTENASAVFHGAQGGDEADYPDCRPEFLAMAGGAISNSVPDDQDLKLRTPLIGWSKSQVIAEGGQAGVDFRYTYSCYSEVEDMHNPTPCGECPACVERAEAFETVGISDPHERKLK